MMNQEMVVLVDETGKELGLMPKMEAHEKGVLHKAISVIIYNDKGQILLQQRSLSKYHWAGIWSNACCTHPRQYESYHDAAKRRLVEELGFDTDLRESFSFIYRAEDHQSGLTEHELDYVFIGNYSGEVPFNKDEVMAVRWVDLDQLDTELIGEPEKFSFWFKIIWKEIKKRALLPA